MRVDKPGDERLARLFAFLDERAGRASQNASSGGPVVRYITLGTRTVRVLLHSPAFLPHMERHLAWSLGEEAASYRGTLVVWQDDIGDIALSLFKPANPAKYRELRALRLAGKAPVLPTVQFVDDTRLRHGPLLDIDPAANSLRAFDPRSNTHYYALGALAPEEFIKRGHLFVHALYALANGPSSHLVHGAAVGLQGTGALLCGIGYRGKSTLTVSALLDGFDYISDDYLIVEKQDDALRAWPIYSMVALSPEMYSARYAAFQGKFLCNNGRKDKYIFNIAAYHEQFRAAYPIKLCLYLRMADCAEPEIVPGDKEIAIEEFALSTLRGPGNVSDLGTIGKLYGFIESFPFYRFTLSRNIDTNTRCLRKFLEDFPAHG